MTRVVEILSLAAVITGTVGGFLNVIKFRGIKADVDLCVDRCMPVKRHQKQVNQDPQGYTLQHVHILQRHSIRAPTHNDPKFSPPQLYPMGVGYLTTVGKQGSLQVGHILREFYKNYLDDNPHSVWARSSTVPRCYETLSLVLNTLYPPKGIWNFGYAVQPIPITMVPDGNDVVIVDCADPIPVPPDFRYLYNLTDPALTRDGFNNFGEFIEWITSKAGYEKDSSKFFEPIIDGLYAQRYSFLHVPSWIMEKWPSVDFAMRKLSFDYWIYDMPYYGDFAGKFVAERLGNATNKDGPKLSIMNYHDTNIQAILNVLEMDVTALYPSFLASLHFQLYKRNSDGTFHVRIMYHQGFTVRGSYRPAVTLNIPSCAFPDCPLERFVKIISTLYPNVDRSKCSPINRKALL